MDQEPASPDTFYYVYILRSLSDGTHYVGYTKNIERRLKEHNSGKSTYTSHHLPYELVYVEKFLDRYEAKEKEKKIKRTGGGKKYMEMRVCQTA